MTIHKLIASLKYSTLVQDRRVFSIMKLAHVIMNIHFVAHHISESYSKYFAALNSSAVNGWLVLRMDKVKCN